MRTNLLLALVASLAFAVTASAQNMRELLYLKNGSIIKGVVIEQIMNEVVKIETYDGSIYAYNWDEVLKITKEEVATMQRATPIPYQRPYPRVSKPTEVKYQGEFLFGYGIGCGLAALDRIYIQTIQGARIGEYFSTGLGIGVGIIPASTFANAFGYSNYDSSNTGVYTSIFLNLKGYLPVNQNTSIFASFDIGGSFGVTPVLDGLSGVLFSPAVGVSIIDRINISFGYDMQRLSYGGGSGSVNFGAVSIKAGVKF